MSPDDMQRQEDAWRCFWFWWEGFDVACQAYINRYITVSEFNEVAILLAAFENLIPGKGKW